MPRFLSAEQMGKIVDTVLAKTKGKKCSDCGGTAFSVEDGFVHFSMINPKIKAVMQIGGPFIPACVLSCSNCGHLDFYSLRGLGLIK